MPSNTCALLKMLIELVIAYAHIILFFTHIVSATYSLGWLVYCEGILFEVIMLLSGG